MTKKIITITISIIFLGLTTFLSAQEQAMLEYYENTSGAARIRMDNGEELNFDEADFGYSIPLGSIIITEAEDYAEIRLNPNGSILKISENTNFAISSLQGVNGADENVFEMSFGKVRTIAAKSTGNEKYRIKTDTAICGIRGTDAGMERYLDTELDQMADSSFVFSGEIEFSKIDPVNQEATETITLKGGEWASTITASFEPLTMTEEIKEEFKKGIEFKQLNPDTVPGHTIEISEQEPEIEVEPEPEQEPEPEITGEEIAQEEAQPEEPGPLDSLGDALKDVLGFEIGTLTLDQITYGKAVLQPTIKIDKFKLILYLPIVYRQDMFNPSDWYKPKGNNEWSFGGDQGDNVSLIAEDIFKDLFLKIKALEWGEQRDPFFIKVGNLNNITIGHGLIMYNYANNSDFPAVRRIGLNLGVDMGMMGFEFMANDLSELRRPEILGGRLYFRPMAPAFPLAFGLSAITDICPANECEYPELLGDPLFLNFGIDLDFPLLESDLMSIILFGDVAAMLPYFRVSVPDLAIESGFDTSAIWYGDEEKTLKNYGIATGLLGNISLFNWRLEGRWFNGMFKPAFYNSLYDRLRSQYVIDTINYLNDPENPEHNKNVLGIYGQGGLSLADMFFINVGYMWPWNLYEDGSVKLGEDDFFMIQAGIEPGLIPLINLSGLVSYERSHFYPAIQRGGDETWRLLFDENTVVKTEVVFGATENFDLVFLYTTTLARDAASGDILLDDDGTPEVDTSISIETRIHF